MLIILVFNPLWQLLIIIWGGLVGGGPLRLCLSSIRIGLFPILCASVSSNYLDLILGNLWDLEIYPGGHGGRAHLILRNRSDNAIEIDYGFSVNDSNGKQVAYKQSVMSQHFAPVGDFTPGSGVASRRGWLNFAKRSKLISSLVDGTLIIEVRMRLSVPIKSSPPPFFIPENPSVCKTIQGVFLDEKYSDIVFEVGGEEKGKDNAMKVAKTAPVTFPAHRLIVANCSNTLAELCESNGNPTTTLVQIPGVSPDVFHLLLSYIYGMKILIDDMISHARGIIDAADKYGVVNLKLEAEACFVEGTIFTIENVMELLLYAESKNCALLKEATMDYIVENKAEVIEKLSFANAPGALITDVLAAVSRGERGSDGDGGDIQYNSLRISELRKMAHVKGLNVDGSREMLIAALKAGEELEPAAGSEAGSEESDEEPDEE